jgi:hypothetical protein
METRVRFEMGQRVGSATGATDGGRRVGGRRVGGRRVGAGPRSGPSVQKSSTSQTRYTLASSTNGARFLSRPRRSVTVGQLPQLTRAWTLANVFQAKLLIEFGL